MELNETRALARRKADNRQPRPSLVGARSPYPSARHNSKNRKDVTSVLGCKSDSRRWIGDEDYKEG
jgi:hypothetical protein